MYTYMQVHQCACVHRSEVIYLYHSPLYFLDYIYLSVFMYTHVYAGHNEHVEDRGHLVAISPLPYHTDHAKDWTQVVAMYLYPLSHLTGMPPYFLWQGILLNLELVDSLC